MASVNVLTGKKTFESMTPCNLTNCTRSEIRQYFENSYELNESLFLALKDQDAFFKCPDRLRLPLIFYFGHTAAVYVNKFILAGLLQPSDRVNLGFETLLETGVDEMSWDDTENYRMGGKFVWPSLAEVVEYRRRVKDLILKVIDETPLELPVTFDSPWWAVFMGMEHERIHLETSSVLIRQLPVNMLERPEGWNYGPRSTGEPVLENKMIHVGATNVTFGKPLDFPSYGWDNEYGKVDCKVLDFEASQYQVTNREFLAFLRAGGYTDQTYWTEEGWRWREYRRAKHPAFWVCGGDCKSACGGDLTGYSHCKAAAHLVNGMNAHCNGHIKADQNGHQGKDEGGGLLLVEETEDESYRLRVMFDVIPMPWDWPVVINFHEAKAFCAWKGPDYRLPSEAEHNVIRGTMTPLSEGWSSDIIHQKTIEANLNLQYGSSTPVNMYPPNELGFYDAMGNVWQWAEDHFNGLPGTLTSAFYDDFSTPCYDGRHNLILGGSWISTGDEASRFARFAFRRHFLQHAGFRLVRTVAPEQAKLRVPIRLIEEKVYVQGVGSEANPTQLPEIIEYKPVHTTNIQYIHDTEEMLADQLHNDWELELPPATVFAKHAIEAANKYAPNISGRTLYVGCGTGRGAIPLSQRFEDLLAVDYNGRFIDTCLSLQKGETVKLPGGKSMTLAENELAKVTFKQLTWLPNEVGFFDFILTTSFDRVLNYKAWLKRMKEVLNSGGLLVVVSQLHGAESIGEEIKSKFDLLERRDMPVANGIMNVVKVTVWKRH